MSLRERPATRSAKHGLAARRAHDRLGGDTHMPSRFAVAAWTELLTCSRRTPQTEGVMAQFRRV
jgi:hypothetical protein